MLSNCCIDYILQKADMVISGLTITTQREEVVDFTYPFWDEPTAVMFKVDPKDQFFITSPLKNEVWLTLIGAGILCVLTVGFMEVCVIKKKAKSSKILQESSWYIIGAQFMQGEE